MNRFDNMIEENKKRNGMKINEAKDAIKKLLKENKPVTVTALARMTGLSRDFFYSNDVIRAELDKAKELQKGRSFLAPRTNAINKAMEKEIELLKKSNKEKDKIIESLKKVNEKLMKRAIKRLDDL